MMIYATSNWKLKNPNPNPNPNTRHIQIQTNESGNKLVTNNCSFYMLFLLIKDFK